MYCSVSRPVAGTDIRAFLGGVRVRGVVNGDARNGRSPIAYGNTSAAEKWIGIWQRQAQRVAVVAAGPSLRRQPSNESHRTATAAN